MLSSPPGLGKVANCNWPSCEGFVCPERVALTTPYLVMVTAVALLGR